MNVDVLPSRAFRIGILRSGVMALVGRACSSVSHARRKITKSALQGLNEDMIDHKGEDASFWLNMFLEAKNAGFYHGRSRPQLPGFEIAAVGVAHFPDAASCLRILSNGYIFRATATSPSTAHVSSRGQCVSPLKGASPFNRATEAPSASHRASNR